MKLVKFLTTVNHDNEEYQINEIVDIEDNAVISINEAQFNGLVKVKAIRLLTDEETEFHTFKESPKEILLKNDQLDQKENDTQASADSEKKPGNKKSENKDSENSEAQGDK